MGDTSERVTCRQELLDVHVELPFIPDSETARRAAGPLPGLLRRPNPRFDALELLLVLDLRQVAHDVGDHRVQRLLQRGVVHADREPDVEALHARLVLQAVLDEVVDFRPAEAGEAGDLVDDHDVELTVGDVVPQLVVDVALAAAGRPANDLGVLDHFVGFDVLLKELVRLVQLSLDILVLGTYSCVDGGPCHGYLLILERLT